jgi:arginine decarboxylase
MSGMQEMLGSAHNLFGSVHIAHVRALGDGDFTIEHILLGQSAGQVLAGTYHADSDLIDKLVIQANSAIATGNLSTKEGDLLVTNYRRCLNSYTYFSRQ